MEVIIIFYVLKGTLVGKCELQFDKIINIYP